MNNIHRYDYGQDFGLLSANIRNFHVVKWNWLAQFANWTDSNLQIGWPTNLPVGRLAWPICKLARLADWTEHVYSWQWNEYCDRENVLYIVDVRDTHEAMHTVIFLQVVGRKRRHRMSYTWPITLVTKRCCDAMWSHGDTMTIFMWCKVTWVNDTATLRCTHL